MPATEAQIRASRLNNETSTGQTKTQDGESHSRPDALEHGPNGSGIVLPEDDDAEVERLSEAFRSELKAEGDVGRTLTRRMAIMTVRMDRCAEQETAALSRRVRDAVENFAAPEGIEPDEVDRLRAEEARRATFDPSREACLARKHEAAAERSFFRALKELRLHQKQSGASSMVASGVAAEVQASMARLGSFLSAEKEKAAPAQASTARLGSFLPEEKKAAPIQAPPAKPTPSAPSKPSPRAAISSLAPSEPSAGGSSYVPIAIGRAR